MSKAAVPGYWGESLYFVAPVSTRSISLVTLLQDQAYSGSDQVRSPLAQVNE